MRITQTMLQNNMLNNLFKSQAQMDKYLTQINTGKKIRRPSEDPVIAMKGMGHRTELAEVEQYRRNASEINSWMDHSDDALDKATKAMQRIEYLSVQAANGTYGDDERKAIAAEVEQLKEQLIDIANTNVNGKYIFNGTDTDIKPVQDKGKITEYVDKDGKRVTPANPEEIEDGITKLNGRDQSVNIEVSKGITFPVNVAPDTVFDEDLFTNIDNFIDALKGDLDGSDQQTQLNESMKDLGESSLKIINTRAELGARMNRLELIEDRLSQQEVISTDTMMKNEGVDFEEAVMNLLTQEVIHRAALAAGSKIIQPSLVDFLR